jgi:hypothetical protein
VSRAACSRLYAPGPLDVEVGKASETNACVQRPEEAVHRVLPDSPSDALSTHTRGPPVNPPHTRASTTSLAISVKLV